MFSHFTPETVALLTSVQNSALEEWAAAEPAASPALKAIVGVAVARKLLDLASMGERDPERLRKAALSRVPFITPVENACGNDPCRSCPRKERSQSPFRIKHPNSDRLRLRILAAARRADLVAMHDYIVTYHQLLGIEEGEPDRAGKAPAPNKGATHIDVRASRRRKG